MLIIAITMFFCTTWKPRQVWKDVLSNRGL